MSVRRRKKVERRNRPLSHAMRLRKLFERKLGWTSSGANVSRKLRTLHKRLGRQLGSDIVRHVMRPSFVSLAANTHLCRGMIYAIRFSSLRKRWLLTELWLRHHGDRSRRSNFKILVTSCKLWLREVIENCDVFRRTGTRPGDLVHSKGDVWNRTAEKRRWENKRKFRRRFRTVYIVVLDTGVLFFFQHV
jgi:hypothetical protein